MTKLSIIHDYPISYFPPAMNLVDTIEDKIDIEVITTTPDNGMLVYSPKLARLYVPVCNKKSDNSLLRQLKAIWFVIACLFRLIRRKPDAILYYESISAMPAYLYKRYINSRVNVFAHYHEYMTYEEYNRSGMRLTGLNHDIERKWLYQHCDWVSQTNAHRLNMFLEDNPMIDRSKAHVFPNYPPKSWWRKDKVHSGDIVKCVYVGSLSLKDTFVKEFCEWIQRQNGKVTFEIYSFNFHQDTLDAVESLKCPYIQFHKEGIPYMQIPDLLDMYDVGVLLYKATTINFQWNETNKFYEYLICGLDVWYPKEMLLLHVMDKAQFSPQIKELDFDHIDNFIYSLDKSHVANSSYCMFADDVYNKFVHII